MAKGLILLTCYHLLLFRHFYFVNPYVYARSEALEQGFACSVFLGRCLRRHAVVDDPYYYPHYRALPFLSSYYPPHVLQAWLGSWLPLNQAWVLYSLTMVGHFLLSSFGCFLLLPHRGTSWLPACAGALTLSSLGYAMKQNSAIVYTCAWIPIYLLSSLAHQTVLSGISLGLMLLAGYWPLALYAIPLGCCCWRLA